MARRIFHFLRGINRDTIVIAGSFAPAGTGAPTTLRGKGFSVARTSTGLFTITLTDRFYECVSFTASLQLASGDDKLAQCGSVDLSAKTAQIRIWDKSAAAVADVSADANNRVNFALELRNTTRI